MQFKRSLFLFLSAMTFYTSIAFADERTDASDELSGAKIIGLTANRDGGLYVRLPEFISLNGYSVKVNENNYAYGHCYIKNFEINAPINSYQELVNYVSPRYCKFPAGYPAKFTLMSGSSNVGTGEVCPFPVQADFVLVSVLKADSKTVVHNIPCHLKN